MKQFAFLFSACLFAVQVSAQLVDSDFGTWSGGLPEGWAGSKTNLAAASINEIDNDGGFGDAAVQLVRTESGHERFTTQPLDVEAGVSYEITFWARGNGDVRTGLFDDRSEGFGYVYNSYVSLSSGEWNAFTQTVTAEETVSNAEFIFSVRNTSGMHVQIDRAVIAEAGAPEAVSIYDIQFTTDPSGDSPLAGSTVLTGGIVTAFWEDNGFWIQNNSGPWQGIFVFAPNQTLVEGDSVVLTAQVVEHFDMTQLTNPTGLNVESTGNAVPAPAAISTADANTEAFEGVLVQVSGAEVVNPNSGFGQFIVNDGSGEALINRNIYDFFVTQGEVLDITGPTYYSFQEFKIKPRSAADVQPSLSTSSRSASDLNVFPVPASDVLNVDWSALDTERVDYTLFDLSGKAVRQGTWTDRRSEISVSALPAGMYQLQLRNGSEVVHRPVAVTR